MNQQSFVSNLNASFKKFQGNEWNIETKTKSKVFLYSRFSVCF